MSDKPHTPKQRASLHLWLRQVTETLIEHGYTVEQYISAIESDGMELPITEGLVKEMYRGAYTATTGHESTTDANTTDYDPAYHAMVLFFGRQGIQLPPWPDRFTQSYREDET